MSAPDNDHLVSTLLKLDRSRLEKLKDDPKRSVVYRAQIDGRSYVLKVYRAQHWKRWLRLSPSWREWRKARLLAAGGVRCSFPLSQPLNADGELLILPFVDGRAMHHLARSCQDRQLRLRLACAVGRQIRRLLDLGLVNRDQKLSNLIADAACVQEGDEPVMIDPLGIRKLRDGRQIVKMFATLLRTTLREGPISVREGMRCLKTAMGDAALARVILGELER
ncbi:MAG: serine/threonine protein kinase [Phycisphaeraceae bacterium]|nr:serine/threonine protein kinase [Phycisphaeraceae bacterium]